MKLTHLFSQMSDDQLISKTKILAAQERELLTLVLHHLAEVDRRRLFAKLKFKSLFEYAVQELGYSDDQAFRRVTAARLLKQVPEIEEKIQTGALTLASLSVAATAIRHQSKESKATTQEIKKIVQLVEGKSKREAESALVKEQMIPAEGLRPEKFRRVGENVEIRMTITPELADKIQQLKSLIAHSDPNIGTAELFEKLCDAELKNLVAKRQCGKNKLSAKVVRAVFQKSKSKCENCKSEHALEIDHKTPRAKGGRDDISNLRLLCRSCNQRAAIEQFGLPKMEPFLNTT